MPADPPEWQAQGLSTGIPKPGFGSEASTCDSLRPSFSSLKESRSRSLASHSRGFSVIVAPLHVDRNNAWQAFLLCTCNNCSILIQWIHRVGMPHTSVADKMPYWSDAMRDPSRVTLRPAMQQAVAAASSGTWNERDLVARPMPHFRTQPPGIKAMLAANFLLLYICFTVKV